MLGPVPPLALAPMWERLREQPTLALRSTNPPLPMLSANINLPCWSMRANIATTFAAATSPSSPANLTGSGGASKRPYTSRHFHPPSTSTQVAMHFPCTLIPSSKTTSKPLLHLRPTMPIQRNSSTRFQGVKVDLVSQTSQRTLRLHLLRL